MSKVDGKTFSIDLVAGAIAGGVARMVVAPFDLIKIRFQIQQGRTSGIFPAQASTDVQYRSVWQTIRDIVRTEGLWAFWKGTWSAQLLTMIYGAVQFSTYQQIHPLITQSVPDSSFGVSKQNAASLVGGAISGCVATVASYPFDLLRTRMAAQQDTKEYKSLRDGLSSVMRTHGVRGLFSGLWPAVIGIAPYAALTFGSYEWAKRTLLQWPIALRSSDSETPQLSSSSIGACGVFAGAFSKFATYPLDVIKKRYQIAGFKYASHHSSTTAPPITGIWSCASSIVRKEGWLALYKGTVPSLLKAAPNAGVSFAVYEFLRSLLKADSK